MAKFSRNVANLTDEFAAAAVHVGSSKSTLYQDVGTPCFCLRVMQTGSKAWVMNDRARGQRSLGPVSDMKASRARVLAEETQTQLATGVIGSKLAIHQRPGTEAVTFLTALKMFELTQHPAATYMKGMSTTIGIYGKDLLKLPMALITRDEAVGAVTAAWKLSLRQGDLLKTYANRLYRNENLESPFTNIKNMWQKGAPPYSIPPELMPRFLDAIDELRNIGTRDILWTALLTGFRPLAVVNMEWQHLCLDPGNSSYFIPEKAVGFKGGKSWKYPLPEFLARRLRKRRETKEYGPWIFHSPVDSNKHVTNYREAVLTLRQTAGMPELQPYHLRDTRGTYAERFFGQTLITQRLLNHRPDYVPDSWVVEGKMVPTSNSTHKYVLTEETEMRSYVERYADVIMQLGGRQQMSDVVRAVFLDNRALAARERTEVAIKMPDVGVVLIVNETVNDAKRLG
jgi:integrase